jgi:hypothetical protein
LCYFLDTLYRRLHIVCTQASSCPWAWMTVPSHLGRWRATENYTYFSNSL